MNSIETDDQTLLASLKSKKGIKICHSKRQKSRLKPLLSSPGSAFSKNKDLARKRRAVGRKVKRSGSKEPRLNGEIDQVRKKRNGKKKEKIGSELDEPARLQRRTRYLLIKMKLEQNLIDAYSAEGWKGQSREKIRPEKELQRAMDQILKCKLGVRDVIRQLDSLSSAGSIEDTVMAPDGSVYHEHIFCAKCKSNEAFPDNDIILCDGTCNSAFHQKCLDPPLDTDSIPPGDQGWFCKFCDCRMEILDALNAHLGTHFSMKNSWEDVFEEEASIPEGGNASLNPDDEWPSDDSADVDYDPEKIENSCSVGVEGTEDECSSDGSVGSDDSSDAEILCGRRQRRDVDYIKLHDEMFGKDAPPCEQLSEDEDWGPTKRRKRVKDSDAATTTSINLQEKEKSWDIENGDFQAKSPCETNNRRSFFRIPSRAVERLRQIFAENELPSRDVKENISKELGLDSEKVSKWFKNARYLALKTRKAERENPDAECQNVIKENGDFKMSENHQTEPAAHFTKNVKMSSQRKWSRSLSAYSTKKHLKEESMVFGDDVTLKKLVKERNKERQRVEFIGGRSGCCNDAEAEMERLCKLKGRLEAMKQRLVRFENRNSKKSVIYVPVAELREKP